MRWLFLLLLAVNIIFFSWNLFKGDNNDASSSRNGTVLSTTSKKLMLLSEIDLSPKVKSHPEDESLPALKPDNTILTADPQPAASDPSSTTTTTVESPQTITHETGLCYVLGPFASGTEAQRVITRTATTTAIVERRWSSPRIRPGYLVHIPPAANIKEARSTISVLNTAGISDARIIPSGEMKYAVALGIFPTIESARKRLKKVHKYDIDVTINEVRIRKRQHWLALRGNNGTRLPKVVLNNLLKDIQGVTVERRSCANLYR